MKNVKCVRFNDLPLNATFRLVNSNGDAIDNNIYIKIRRSNNKLGACLFYHREDEYSECKNWFCTPVEVYPIYRPDGVYLSNTVKKESKHIYNIYDYDNNSTTSVSLTDSQERLLNFLIKNEMLSEDIKIFKSEIPIEI